MPRPLSPPFHIPPLFYFCAYGFVYEGFVTEQNARTALVHHQKCNVISSGTTYVTILHSLIYLVIGTVTGLV